MSAHDHPVKAEEPAHTNRLIHETSPYLLQHAHNPVDWYPWGEEALGRARERDLPILLSVGYSACHWCHVMAHESFEDEATARLMNTLFVPVKVDREERPDIDALYMEAVQALTGRGGWPMTVFLTPDGAPFYGGTYFPPEDRYGMPGFPSLLRRIANYYRDHRAEVEQQADAFRDFFQQQSRRALELPADLDLASATVDPGLLDDAADRLLARLDAVQGGFGRAPKFPHSMALDLLLRVHSRHAGATDEAVVAERARMLHAVTLTLDKMAGGGMYDQIGGGFHRYSTDAQWLVPHFEKMLYDNALLAQSYLSAWQVTGEARYRRVCEETLDYVLREMADPAGGFYSTQDADSEGVEGKFYVWSAEELRAALPDDQFAVAQAHWGVTAEGNFEGHNILHMARPLDEVAADLGIGEDEARAAIAAARATLYQRRAERVWPGRDDKVITSWNGLMLRALAEAARVLNRADYRVAAETNASFVLTQLADGDELSRTWRRGQAKGAGYLEDYAALVNGLLSLYAATGAVRWFSEARRLAEALLGRFWDDEIEGFFDTAHGAEALIGRPRELTDGATPAGASLAAEGLLRLAAYTGEARYHERAARVMLPLATTAAERPDGFAHLLGALNDLIGPLREVALIGTPGEPGLAALAHEVNARYLPRTVVASASPEDAAHLATVPLLRDRPAQGGHATAYVCEGFACLMPTTDAAMLAAQLDADSSAPPAGAPS
ncbi:MAG TPA: thioredoxin domain-containing protein [Ktedonobacterales bacterium]|nr:thioredoxin domain-containing protein [Ktedonobacterales bacterium]